jgi:alpha-ketoglutarate-dependent taurine dioxygenase
MLMLMVRHNALLHPTGARRDEISPYRGRPGCRKRSLVSLEHREQLIQRGWATIVEAITEDDMLSVAWDLGQPTPSPTGELIKVLVPTLAADAPHQTLSSQYGTGSQPLHTDTAFWPVPVRYVVLSVRGDKRRATELLSFDDATSALGTSERSLVDRSVWRARPGVGNFYCSMRFQCDGTRGWRFDPITMVPINAAALTLQPALDHILRWHDQRMSISWTDISCIIIDNWRVLHARGAPPVNEGHRQLFRIYVR